MSEKRIFLSAPHMAGTEQDFIKGAFEANFIAPLGPDLDAFEREMAAHLGLDPEAGHCVAVASGTAAMHLALRILGVDEGDDVLCSDLTFIGSVTPVLFQRARPVFVDAEAASWNMDLDLLARHLKARQKPYKACILVHLFGMPANLDKAAQLLADAGAPLVEDAAESLGAAWRGRPTGVAGRFGVLSFNGNKIITTGGGGMLVCRRPEDAARARFLATQARDPAPHYQHSELGYNYRLSNVSAAIGRGQLGVLDQRVDARRRVYDGYRRRLEGLDLLWQEEPEGARANRWLSAFVLGPSHGETPLARARRDAVMQDLADQGIESRPVFKPMSLQPLFAEAPLVHAGKPAAPVGHGLFERGLCLPSGSDLDEADLDRVAQAVRRALQSV